ncbi:hypothetical protein ACH0CI_26770 [Priestia sp. 179-F W1.4 NHS]|uniref:hypothetical protein n=1 Tax=Priestia sp. 179-F W1.4 NHS TaxID=3374296 RepID=UPI00387A2612
MHNSIRAKILTVTNEHGWGVSLQLVASGQYKPYYTGSYYFPKTANGSATRSIYKTIDRACELLPKGCDVVFEGTHPTFVHQKHILTKYIKKVIGEEENILIFHHRKLYGLGVLLAEEALLRRTNLEREVQ